jgi:hypothetical protein
MVWLFIEHWAKINSSLNEHGAIPTGDRHVPPMWAAFRHEQAVWWVDNCSATPPGVLQLVNRSIHKSFNIPPVEPSPVPPVAPLNPPNTNKESLNAPTKLAVVESNNWSNKARYPNPRLHPI